MTNNNIKVKTHNKRYSILIGTDLIDNFSKILKKNSVNFEKCLIIIDKNVPKKLINITLKSISKKK